MIIGDPSIFAIESSITRAYERLSFLALGFFTVHINGRRYGVCKPDASMLACSYEEVRRRIARRGLHVAAFASEPDPGKIADALRDAEYDDIEETRFFLEFVKPKSSVLFTPITSSGRQTAMKRLTMGAIYCNLTLVTAFA